MSPLLVVPDGASEPLSDGPTSLEQARTPVLDALAAAGTVARVRTIPEGLPAGTEIGLPVLLGVPPLARGRIEAAAAGIEVGPEEGAWRLDVLDGHRPAEVGDDDVAALDTALGQMGGRVRRLRGHRLLLVGPAWWGPAPPGPHQTARPLRELAVGPFGGVAKAARTALGGRLVAWPWGDLGARPTASAVSVLVVAGGGVPVGLARLFGWQVTDTVPDPLPAATLVVVHVPDADDAAHARDRAGKIDALERLDALVGELHALDPDLRVIPDHGCDPVTGAHTADPVPALDARPGPGAPRFTERAAAAFPVREAAAWWSV